jgi:putative transport protein
MELDVVGLLKEHPEIMLFIIIGVGYLVGKTGAWGIQLGSSIGVLFIALVFGHYRFELSPIVGTLGFIFFIYSVGVQAGPHFFSTFRQDGVRYIQIGLVVAISAFLTARGMAWLWGLDPGYAAGVLAGGLTSTPTLAAAQDAVSSGLVSFPAGYTAHQIESNIAVAYAVTYIFGLIGLILFLQLAPRLLRVDLVKESQEAQKKLGDKHQDGDDERGMGRKGMPSLRTYSVTNPETIGKSLTDLRFLQTTGAVIAKLLRVDEEVTLGPETVLQEKDRVLVLGYNENQLLACDLLGKEVFDSHLMENTAFDTQKFMVIRNEVSGKTLRETGITNQFACITHKVTRGGVDLPVSLDMIIQRGDYITASGPKENMERLGAHLGAAEKPIHETDLLTFAFGIAAGLFVGYITVKVGNLPLGIGSAGGLLTIGLIVGWARTIHPLFGRVPAAARYILMELGLLLFLAGVGVRAGGGLVEGLLHSGIPLFLSGALVTLVPALAGLVYGKVVLKMNPAVLFGATCGGMTSTPALGAVAKVAKSNVPAMGYVGVYAFANIILTVAGQLMMLL